MPRLRDKTGQPSLMEGKLGSRVLRAEPSNFSSSVGKSVRKDGRKRWGFVGAFNFIKIRQHHSRRLSCRRAHAFGRENLCPFCERTSVKADGEKSPSRFHGQKTIAPPRGHCFRSSQRRQWRIAAIFQKRRHVKIHAELPLKPAKGGKILGSCRCFRQLKQTGTVAVRTGHEGMP